MGDKKLKIKTVQINMHSTTGSASVDMGVVEFADEEKIVEKLKKFWEELAGKSAPKPAYLRKASNHSEYQQVSQNFATPAFFH